MNSAKIRRTGAYKDLDQLCGNKMDPTGTGSLSAKASKIFRVRKTTAQMLHKRKYNVPEEDLDIDGNQFQERVCSYTSMKQPIMSE